MNETSKTDALVAFSKILDEAGDNIAGFVAITINKDSMVTVGGVGLKNTDDMIDLLENAIEYLIETEEEEQKWDRLNVSKH